MHTQFRRCFGALVSLFFLSACQSTAPRAATPAAPAANAAPAPASGSLTVQRFEFTGNTVYTAENLSDITKPYTGRALSLPELYKAADKVAAFYAGHGYTLAAVTVPPQSVASGVVRLEVLEGRIGKVLIEGNNRYTLEQVEHYLPGIAEGKVYQSTTLEAGLDRISHLPGLPQARAVLRPGAEYGTSDVLIQAHEETFSAGLAVDNHGREALGETRTSINATLNNPLRLADEVQALYLRSSSGLLEYGNLGYGIGLGQDSRLTASYGEARFNTTLVGLTGITVDGLNRSARLAFDTALTRMRSQEFVLGAAVSNTEATADLQGIAISAVKLSLLELSARQRQTFASGAVTQWSATVATSFGSACEMSAGCEDQPLRFEADAQRLQPLVGRLDGYLRVNSVYSPDPLPELTQVSLGGPTNVRGHPSAEVRGDIGAFASAGLRQAFSAGPVTILARVFGDAGRVSAQSPYGSSNTLSSVGVGLDAYWRAQAFSASARMDLSFPTDNHDENTSPPPSDPSDQRLFASLSVNF